MAQDNAVDTIPILVLNVAGTENTLGIYSMWNPVFEKDLTPADRILLEKHLDSLSRVVGQIMMRVMGASNPTLND